MFAKGSFVRRTYVGILGLVLVLGLLAGCAQAQTAATPGPASQATEAVETEAPATGGPESLGDVLSGTGTPTTPIQNLGNTPTAGERPTPTPFKPQPQDDLVAAGVTWDTSPTTQVISVTHCCGFVPEIVVRNYIPEATIFGDGTIVWVERADNSGRQVLVGKLRQETLVELVKSAQEAGFFEWQELYTDPMSPTDLPSKCIAIQLKDQSKRVCEYYKGAPAAFHQIYDQVSQGMQLKGQPFTPQRAFLTVEVLEGEVSAGSSPWDAVATGVSLAEAAKGGIWVEGPALEAAWKLVNSNPWGVTVEEAGKHYILGLQIPGMSLTQPPAQIQ